LAFVGELALGGPGGTDPRRGGAHPSLERRLGRTLGGVVVNTLSRLTVVKSQLLTFLNVPSSKETQLRKVWVQTIDVHIEDAEIWIAAVVYEVAQVPKECRVYRVYVLVAEVEVQVKEIGPAVCVILLAAALSLLGGDHLPHVLDNEAALLNLLQRLHAPAAAVVSPVNCKFNRSSFLHHSVSAGRWAFTSLVALVNWITDVNS